MNRRRQNMMGRDIFTANGEFIICPVSNEDRSDYVELHRQLNGDSSLYLNPVSKDMMWEQILNHADSVFSLFTAKGDYCGRHRWELSSAMTGKAGRYVEQAWQNVHRKVPVWEPCRAILVDTGGALS